MFFPLSLRAGLLARLVSTFRPPLAAEKPLLAPESLPETSEVLAEGVHIAALARPILVVRSKDSR